MKTSKRIASQADATGEQQLAGFIKKFDSTNAALIRSVRKLLRERLPTANETGLRQLQLFRDWVLLDRATLRLHLVHCRRREWSWAVVLLRSHAPRSS